MGAPYTSVSVTGYNANPPADDGSAVATNQVKWATQKTKLGDPLNTAIASINSNILAAFGKVVGGAGVNSQGVSYAVVSGDQGKLVRATASGLTLTFPDATSVGSPFVFGLLNSSAGNITLAGASAQTINGSTSITMAAGDGYQAFTDGSNWFVIGRKTGVLPRGYIDGCVIANGADATNDITIAAGVVRDSTNTVDINVAAMATGKQLDANWAPGDAAGMRNSAAGIANSTYHLYAVAKADGTQDIYAHTSTVVATVLAALQAESGGASYVYARRIGSIIRVSAAILAFKQRGNFFRLSSVVTDRNASALGGTAAVTQVLTVPVGIAVQANFFGVMINNGGTMTILFSELDSTDTTPGVGLGYTSITNNDYSGGEWKVWTDTAASVRARVSTNLAVTINTLGWMDLRGTDA